MRILLLIFTISLITVCSYGQEVQWGPLVKMGYPTYRILPDQGTDFYTVHMKGMGSSSIEVVRFEGMNIAAEQKINTKVSSGTATLLKTLNSDDGLIALLMDEHDDTETVYLQRYGTNCLPLGDAVEVISFNQVKDQDDREFGVVQSENKQFIVIEYTIPSDDDANLTPIQGYIILDNKQEILSKHEFALPYDEERIDVMGHFVSNTGDYFFLMEQYEANVKGKRGEFEKTSIMYATSEGIEEMPFTFDTYKPVSVSFSSIGDKIYCHGKYFEGKGESKRIGVFCTQLNLEKQELSNQIFAHIDDSKIHSEITEKFGKKQISYAYNGFKNYDLREIRPLPDGSFAGLFEQYHVQISTTTGSNGQTTTRYYYHYDDVLAYRVSPDGEILWMHQFPKRQVSGGEGRGSIASYVTEEELVFFYNDHNDNYNMEGDFELKEELQPASKSEKDNCVSRVRIDLQSGEAEHKKFFTRAEEDGIAVVEMFKTDYINNQMYLLLEKNGGKEKYGVISFGQ